MKMREIINIVTEAVGKDVPTAFITEETKTVAEKYITDVYRRLKRLGHANIIVWLEPEGDHQVSIDSIDAKVQEGGFGERAIKIITRHADRYGVTLTLAVTGYGNPSENRLVRWYQRHGFAITKSNYNPDGEEEQYTYSDMMRRPLAEPVTESYDNFRRPFLKSPYKSL